MSRRLMLRNASGDSGGTLPPEYQQVEWIESPDGNANHHINTGLNAVAGAEIKAVFQQNPNITPYKFLIVFGGYDNSGIAYVTYRPDSYGGRWRQANTGNISNPWDGLVHTAILSASGLQFDDAHHQFSSNGDGNTIPIYLFTWNYYGTADYASRGLRFLRYTVKQNGNFIMDLIPCYRKADNKTGMYDVVGRAFLTDEKGGEFLLGADVN